MDDLKYLEALPIKELKQIQKRIAKIVEEREEEREKIMRQYQEELDRLLNMIKDDGFFVNMFDFPNPHAKVMKWEDD